MSLNDKPEEPTTPLAQNYLKKKCIYILREK